MLVLTFATLVLLSFDNISKIIMAQQQVLYLLKNAFFCKFTKKEILSDQWLIIPYLIDALRAPAK